MTDTGSGFGGDNNMGYDLLLSLGFALGKGLVAHFTRAKMPQDIIDAAQKVVDAIEAHANDKMTRTDWEALRG